jgi:hypothetical protein
MAIPPESKMFFAESIVRLAAQAEEKTKAPGYQELGEG